MVKAPAKFGSKAITKPAQIRDSGAGSAKANYAGAYYFVTRKRIANAAVSN